MKRPRMRRKLLGLYVWGGKHPGAELVYEVQQEGTPTQVETTWPAYLSDVDISPELAAILPALSVLWTQAVRALEQTEKRRRAKKARKV